MYARVVHVCMRVCARVHAYSRPTRRQPDIIADPIGSRAVSSGARTVRAYACTPTCIRM